MNMRNGRATKLVVVITGALALTGGLAGTAAADSTDPDSTECRQSFADVDNDDGAGCRYKYDSKKEAREYRKLDHDEKDGGDEDIRYGDKYEGDSDFEKIVKIFSGG